MTSRSAASVVPTGTTSATAVPPRLGDGLHGLLGDRLVDVVDDHPGAVGGEGVRVGESEAPAAAGDDGDLAGEIDAGHGWSPFHMGCGYEIEAKSNNW
ncbi:hypothetical protein RKD19_001486 [Streptomyces canus]